MLADPVESEDDPVLVDDDDDVDGVVVLVDVDDVTVDVDAPLDAVAVPACACAATIPSAATAAVPTTPNVLVSLPRSRSARSRSAAVMRRLGAAISAPPGGLPLVLVARHGQNRCHGASAPRHADR